MTHRPHDPQTLQHDPGNPHDPHLARFWPTRDPILTQHTQLGPNWPTMAHKMCIPTVFCFMNMAHNLLLHNSKISNCTVNISTYSASHNFSTFHQTLLHMKHFFTCFFTKVLVTRFYHDITFRYHTWRVEHGTHIHTVYQVVFCVWVSMYYTFHFCLCYEFLDLLYPRHYNERVCYVMLSYILHLHIVQPTGYR